MALTFERSRNIFGKGTCQACNGTGYARGRTPSRDELRGWTRDQYDTAQAACTTCTGSGYERG